MKLLTPEIKDRLEGWKRPQVRALLRIMKRFGPERIAPENLFWSRDFAGVTVAGMFIGIEKNGYAHT